MRVSKNRFICMARYGFAICCAAYVSAAAPAVAKSHLSVQLQGLTAAGTLPISSAFCMPKGSPLKAQDESPGVTWSSGPPGTKSYVLIAIDPDVVKNLSLMNKPGVTIPINAPRMNIYHWVLIDIPAAVTSLAPGEDGDHFVPGGKPIGPGEVGIRGTNDYWPYFNKRPGAPLAMHGPYGGYDGPCPPANDLLAHTYVFRVYALDVPSLNMTGQFFAPEVLKAISGHVLAQGEARAKFSYSGS